MIQSSCSSYMYGKCSILIAYHLGDFHHSPGTGTCKDLFSSDFSRAKASPGSAISQVQLGGRRVCGPRFITKCFLYIPIHIDVCVCVSVRVYIYIYICMCKNNLYIARVWYIGICVYSQARQTKYSVYISYTSHITSCLLNNQSDKHKLSLVQDVASQHMNLEIIPPT